LEITVIEPGFKGLARTYCYPMAMHGVVQWITEHKMDDMSGMDHSGHEMGTMEGIIVAGWKFQ